jgi:polysaccharide biosynthesis protein PslG
VLSVFRSENNREHAESRFVCGCRAAAGLLLIVPTLWAHKIPFNSPVPDSLGVNIHFLDPAPGEMQELASSGARWIRMDFSWADTERTKGRYNFSEYDRLVAALDRYHIRPILILDYGNNLYDQGLAPYTDTGRQAFANWAAAAVKHFHGLGIVWEMWNEPNGFFWKPKRNVQNYILLALAVGEAIRETEPGAIYIGPAGAVIDFPFLKACFQAGLLNYWDGVSVHPYRQRIPETVIPLYDRLRRLISEYAPRGKVIPIISGEWGYPGIPSWWGMNDQRQADMLAREWLTNIANGVAISIWYDWRDGPTPTDPGSHCGLVSFGYHAGEDPVYTPKPAYLAARTLTHTLDGYSFRARLQVGGPDDYVLLFTQGKQARLVVWTTSATPHELLIPRSRGRFQVTELEGQKRHSLRAHRHGLAVTLTIAPQYLIPRKADQLRAVNIGR